jgi:hypothetical protein
MRSRWLGLAVLLTVAGGLTLDGAQAASAAKPRSSAKPASVGKPVSDQVVIDLSRPVNTFKPIEALGAAVDGAGRGDVDQYLTPYNIKTLQSAGLRRITYRTRPELGIEAWHWSEEGSWSDPARQQGYWTSSDASTQEPRVTWGYTLPRRGDSVDQANDTGYSRIDDGDPDSFWKSNPYLDRRYTGLPQSRPQWIVVSLAKDQPIDAVQIAWGAPFARHFLVQCWTGKNETDKTGRWETFPGGDRTMAGDVDNGTQRLAPGPIKSRLLRILLLQSSETAAPGSTDIRDRLGYAVREVAFGLVKTDGRIADVMRHGKTRDGQTLIQVSSTDPWHRASDRDLDTEQPSLDMMFKTGLNGGLPLIVPVGVYYDTPENAAAEVRYIRRRGWPVHQIELGEEADGQFIAPEDYADLYLEFAGQLHAIDPTLSLGGPSMQGAMTYTWPDPEGGPSWIGRFVARLKVRDGVGEFGFFSFEHYAFDDVCYPLGGMLRDETTLMDNIMASAAAAGVPKTIPWIISEYGFSPFSGRAMSEVPSALLSADIVGHFLTLGGDAAFMLGYSPGSPANQIFPCAGYGDMMLYEADDQGRAKWAMPMYYAEQMMIRDWGDPADQPHQLYAATSAKSDAKGRAMVTAYPLRRPDGQWAIMLINRDEQHPHRMRIVFHGAGADVAFGKDRALRVVQYSPADYTWLDRKEASHPTKDLPPARFALKRGEDVLLPAMSLSIVRGAGPKPQ